MAEADIMHMHKDLELMKRDIAIIKHILSEEGELTEEAKARLTRARSSPKEGYVAL